MALVYQASDSILKESLTWKLAFASSIPAMAITGYYVPAIYLPYVYPMLFSPAIYGIYDQLRVRSRFRKFVHKMYLLKTGK